MFLVLGILAIVTAIGTVILGWNGKNAEVLRFIGVSLIQRRTVVVPTKSGAVCCTDKSILARENGHDAHT